MDNALIEVLKNWTSVSTVVGCLVVGFILNNYLDEKNKHIPLIMAGTGILVTLGLNGYVSFEATIITGALSGLASTGAHQVFKQYIKGSNGEAEFFDVYKKEKEGK